MKDHILIEKLKKNVETWKKVAEGMSTGVGTEVLKEKSSFYEDMQMITGNAVRIHSEYLGDSSDERKQPKILNLKSSIKKEKNLIAGKSKVTTLSKEDKEAMIWPWRQTLIQGIC
ncbi:Uncharacterized protein APZ42_033622 [Daphnia magna]|uniref:Uncharacterized protein n=1 Tax=Daphnia magna TaxID=35525 RepID=A0A164KXY6_9CRUS|nr:Uncharacterized protein APZ42_033622 [Daphnia magna]